MGFLSAIAPFISPIFSLISAFGDDDQGSGSTATAQQTNTAESASIKQAEDRERRRKQALVATNAGAQQGSTLNPTGNNEAEVTRKSLLGL